jgi:nucleotide-binding universal stress UspA family protein
MFDTIVWATDGSELADTALGLVEDLARSHGSRIVAVHASEPSRRRGPVTEQIRDQLNGLRRSGLDAELVVRTTEYADVAHVIAASAAEVEADLIVLGTHGRGAVGTAVFGGIAKELLRVASCPVLVVPPRATTRQLVAAGNGFRPASQDVSSL